MRISRARRYLLILALVLAVLGTFFIVSGVLVRTQAAQDRLIEYGLVYFAGSFALLAARSFVLLFKKQGDRLDRPAPMSRA